MTWAETWKPNRQLYVRGPEKVEVYASDRPKRPYKEMGIVEAFGSTSTTRATSRLVSEMRKFAGERGCDALILMGSATDASKSVYRGSCVLFVGPAPAAEPKAPAPAAERACVPDTTQLCHGPGACRGAQSCLADGTGYTSCDCGGEPPAAAPAGNET